MVAPLLPADLQWRAHRQTETSSGEDPAQRTLERRLRLGVILLDKPRGPTSHQVAAWVKQILRIPKAGHGGTLDPNVTGLLPITLGESTKGTIGLHAGDKEYVGILQLHRTIPKAQLSRMFAEFTGPVWQLPPVRSAVKRQLRVRTIHELELLEFEEGRRALFRVRCDSGTYVRVLCHDVGEALGIGGHMLELRRTRTAGLSERDGLVTLQVLTDAAHAWFEEKDPLPLQRLIRPVEELLVHLPAIVLKDSAVAAVAHGAPLLAPGIAAVSGGVSTGQLCRLLSIKGEVVALATSGGDTDWLLTCRTGAVTSTERVLIDRLLYRPSWQTRDRTTQADTAAAPRRRVTPDEVDG